MYRNSQQNKQIKQNITEQNGKQIEWNIRRENKSGMTEKSECAQIVECKCASSELTVFEQRLLVECISSAG